MQAANSTIKRDLIAASALGTFDSIQEAWVGVLKRLQDCGVPAPGVTDPRSVGSDFGVRERESRELIAASFTILQPRRRLVASASRPIDLGYAIANVVWAFTGSNDLEMIAAYNPHGRMFSDDGKTLFGAPGRRVFHSSAGDQFELAAGLLERDPASRRALIQVFLPFDMRSESRDCSCLGSLHFLQRGSELACITHMRSQSALMVLPYDLFLLTMLHEAMAVRLGTGLGPYHQFCGSLHYYNDEQAVVDRVLCEELAPTEEMPPMTSYSPSVREELADAELLVRRNLVESADPAIGLQFRRLDSYWTDLLTVMAAGAIQRRGGRLSPTDFESLPGAYHQSLAARNRSAG